MNSLFDITGDFLRFYEIATSEDADQKTLEDTLESLNYDLSEKGKGYASVIQQLDMEMKKAEEIEKHYAGIKKARKNAIERLKERLKEAMLTMDIKEIPAGDFTIKLVGNGGVAPLKITGDVPENYNKVTVAPDNDRIRKYLQSLKDGETCEWARIEDRGCHVEIK